jgi:DNA-binding response OmpR family regulator
LSDVLLLTGAPESSADILPSLGLLPHAVRLAPAEAASATGGPPADVMLIDARRDLMQAKSLVRQLRGAGLEMPILAVVAEGGWAAVTTDWGADDVILHTAGPGEVDARLRLAIGRRTVSVLAATGEIRRGDLVIDEASYLARLRGRTLDLTFKEFELLKFLAQHPARVFTRSQLLQEVWGYDYFGGTRTVDVHVRRLRAKLGVEHELLIGTVRNVGYRFVPSQGKADARGTPAGASGEPDADAGQPGPAARTDGPAPAAGQTVVADQTIVARDASRAGRESRAAAGGERRPGGEHRTSEEGRTSEGSRTAGGVTRRGSSPAHASR